MVPFKVCEAIKGRVPASSFLRAHFTDKEGRSRNDRSPSRYPDDRRCSKTVTNGDNFKWTIFRDTEN